MGLQIHAGLSPLVELYPKQRTLHVDWGPQRLGAQVCLCVRAGAHACAGWRGRELKRRTALLSGPPLGSWPVKEMVGT